MGSKRKQRDSTKAPVSLRALMARLNRHLEREGKILKLSRGQAKEALGDCYLVHLDSGSVTKNIDPVETARKLGLLKPWEEVRE